MAKHDIETCKACNHQHKVKAKTWEIVHVMFKGERYTVTRCVYSFNPKCAEALNERARAA